MNRNYYVPGQTTEQEPSEDQMSLRDLFALDAMKARIMKDGMPTPISFSSYPKSGFDRIASDAYEMADAMLRAREVQA